MSQLKDSSSNIIDLNSMRFPVGTKAWHVEYRICTILECVGEMRKVRYINPNMEQFVVEKTTVHVNELKKLIHPDNMS